MIIGLAVGGSHAKQTSRAAGLTVAEFQRLHRELQPPKEEWRSLPWQTSLLAARAIALREKKPLYMLVRSGHPLGCV